MKKLLLLIGILGFSVSSMAHLDCYTKDYSEVSGVATDTYEQCKSSELTEVLKKLLSDEEDIKYVTVETQVYTDKTTYLVEVIAGQNNIPAVPKSIELTFAGDRAEEKTLMVLDSFCSQIQAGETAEIIDSVKGNFDYQTHSGRPNMQRDWTMGENVARPYLAEVRCNP